MPKSQDLFDDSTMSFGEHLEILRVHLWKAIIGLSICVVIALFFGDHVIDVVRGPIDRALQQFGITDTQDDITGFDFIAWLKGTVSGTSQPTDGSGITNVAVKTLKNFPKLQSIDVNSTSIKPDGLRELTQQHPGLETSVAPLVVVGLGHLKSEGARCELNDSFEAVSLSLRNTEADTADLDKLKKMTSLERLDLQGLEIDDDSLQFIEPLTSIEFLNLSKTNITETGIQAVSKLTALNRLDLRQMEISDAALKALATLPNLEHLDLRGTPITTTGLEQIGKLKTLQTLLLSGAGITDEGLKHLGTLTALRQLEFKETAVTDAGLDHLLPLKKLETLNFTKGSNASDLFADNLSPELLANSTIDVRIQASQLAAILHQIDPESYPALTAEFEDRSVTLPISAPAFQVFKDTAKNFRKPVTLNVQEAFLTYLKIAFIAGLLLASPWVFYQLWLFVAAGLYPHERKYIYVYLPLSVVLFVGGAVFCFYAVFPFVLHFLLSFNEWLEVTPQIRLSEWISFAIMLPLMFGLAFQLPLVMLFLERISIFDAPTYREKRRMAILVIAVLSMFLTPADPMSMMLMMIPLVILYEFGIMLCAYSPAKSPFETEAA